MIVEKKEFLFKNIPLFFLKPKLNNLNEIKISNNLYENKDNNLNKEIKLKFKQRSKIGIIFAHGLLSNKNSRTNLELAKKLNHEGFTTIHFDFYGHGDYNSKFEDLTISKAKNDLLNIINFSKKKGFEDIYLIGTSFGGLISNLVSSKEISKLVLKSPVSNYFEKDLETKGEEFIQNWKENKNIIYYNIKGKEYKLKKAFLDDFMLKKNDGFRNAVKIKCPVLIIHGEKDNIVPIKQSIKLNSILKNSRLIKVNNMEHRFSKIENKKLQNKLYDEIIKFLIKK